MNTQIDRRVNRIVVHCEGNLDGCGSPELVETIESLVDGATPVVLDLAGVPALTEAGVRTLRQAFEAASDRQATVAPDGPSVLRLANATSAVQNILDISGFTERLAGWRVEKPEASRTYRRLLPRVREIFPTPVSDPLHDAYFVQSVARALDHVDQLKNGHPYLGKQVPLDYDAARAVTLPVAMSSLETVIGEVADYLQGQVNWGHSHTQAQVIPPVTIGSILGQMFGAIYNPNLLWDAYSHRVAQAEIELAAMCAGLVGYDPQQAAGISTFGGTGTELYGVKIGVEKAQPGAFRTGVRGVFKVVSSDASHYCKLNVAAWLGLGLESVVSIPTDNDNSMKLAALEATLRDIFERGEQVACIIATMGTTDAFGLDNVEAIVRMRDELANEYRLPYRPHVHADAVIGWPWAVFNDYDFADNPMDFPPRTLRSLWDARTMLRGLHLADSIGIDFHKTGYGPIVSSLFLCKDHADLSLISRDPAQMPYLFQFGNYHPGIYTLETSRSGGAVLAALANFKLLGKEGYRVILGHIVTMAEVLRAKLEKAPHACLVNDSNHGMVTLFRVYPDGVDANLAYHEETTRPKKVDKLQAHNAYNRRVFEALRRQVERGDGMNLGLTAQYRLSPTGCPIVALKSFVMSPFVDEAAMDYLLACVEKARREVNEPAMPRSIPELKEQ
ncbi:MAG: aspartate aminotransferase family protein [Planctomycetes bacterium]|nr:aspartate aminotransferase family protein [Planctomycetota bacterium]